MILGVLIVCFVIFFILTDAGFFNTIKRNVIGLCCLCIIIAGFFSYGYFASRNILVDRGVSVVQLSDNSLAVEFPTITSLYLSRAQIKTVTQVVNRSGAQSFDKVSFKGLEKFGMDWTKHLKDTMKIENNTGVAIVTGGAISTVNYRKPYGRYEHYGIKINDIVLSTNWRVPTNDNYVYSLVYDRSSWDFVYDFDKKYKVYQKCIISRESLKDFENGRDCWRIISQ